MVADLNGVCRGATPQQLLTGALAACTAMTLRMYGDRKAWDLDGLEVVAEAQPGDHARTARPRRLRLVDIPAHRRGRRHVIEHDLTSMVDLEAIVADYFEHAAPWDAPPAEPVCLLNGLVEAKLR